MVLLLLILPRLVRSNSERRALFFTTRSFLGSSLSAHCHIILDGRHLWTGRSGEHAAHRARARLGCNLVHHIVMRFGVGFAFLKPTANGAVLVCCHKAACMIIKESQLVIGSLLVLTQKFLVVFGFQGRYLWFAPLLLPLV